MTPSPSSPASPSPSKRRTARESPTRERIFAFVDASDEPVSPKEIIEHTGLSESSVYTTVRDMLDDDLLSQPGYGLYATREPDDGADAEPGAPRTSDRDDTSVGETDSSLSSQDSTATAPSSKPKAPDDSALVYVPLSSVRASGGHGEEPFQHEIRGYVAYDRAQIRRETGVDPSRLVVLPITGNSMEPTLRPGDRVIIARYCGEPIVDGTIYVLRRDVQGVVIKRAYWTSDGTLLLRSDNRDAPVDMRVDPTDEDAWQIIGRVVRVEKNL